MRTHTTTAAALLAASLALAATPSAGPTYSPDGAVEVAEARAWFTAGDTAAGNLDQEQDAWIGWEDSPPTSDTGSAVLSAGPVSPIRDNALGMDGEHKAQFTAAGTHTGHLDAIALDLHFVRPHGEVPCDLDTDVELSVGIDLDIDGVRVLDMGSDDGWANYVPVTVERAGDGHVAKLQVSNVHARMAELGLTGDDATRHDLQVAVLQFYGCEESVWRYGSTAAPSSILFNRHPDDPSLAAHTEIDATDPPPGDPPTLERPELPELP